MLLRLPQAIDSSLDAFLRRGFLSYFGSEVFERWLSDCVYFIDQKKLIVQTKDENSAKFINDNLVDAIADFCDISWPGSSVDPVACVDISIPGQPAGERLAVVDNVVSMDENRGHSFEDFIVAEENRVAYDAVCSVVGKSDRVLQHGSVLYLTGDVGVGKTHLLKAAENYASKNKNINACYMSAEVFGGRYVTAVKENRLFDMRNAIIAHDVLLIDDIGFISHRKSTIEELGSIVAVMLDAGKDVIVATTADPSAFSANKRLYSRLLSAVFLPIKTTSPELKQKIIISLITKHKINMPQPSVEYLSKNTIGGAREIKGAINRIRVGKHSDRSLTEIALRSILPDLLVPANSESQYSNNVDTVFGIVADYYRISVDDLKNKRGIKGNKTARSIAMYLCRDLCGLVYERIAKEFGLSAHATVMHSISKLKKDALTNHVLACDLESISEAVRMHIK